MKLKGSKTLFWIIFFLYLVFVNSQGVKSLKEGSKTRLLSEEKQLNSNLKSIKDKADLNHNKSILKDSKSNVAKVDRNSISKNHHYLYSDSKSFSYLSAFDRKHTFLINSFDFDNIYKKRYSMKKVNKK